MRSEELEERHAFPWKTASGLLASDAVQEHGNELVKGQQGSIVVGWQYLVPSSRLRGLLSTA
jgi:hypothetical protein